MADFDPQRARAKRPMPMWWDAFLRDTQHLEADEVGAYMLLLGAMWTTPDCSLPDDPRKLARICRCSLRLFNLRIGPSVLPLMDQVDGKVISWRLRKEACFTEHGVTQQHCRKTGENAGKLLKSLGWGFTVVKSKVVPRHLPTQQPNNLHKKESPSDSVENDSANLPLFGGDLKEQPEKKQSQFDQFWEAYPHRGGAKRGKVASQKKFTAAVKRGVDPGLIIDAAKTFHRDRKVIDGFAPDPATWLNNAGWDDDVDFGSGARSAAPDTDAARQARLKYLGQVAGAMERQGKAWVIGGRFVSDADLQAIRDAGLWPGGDP